MTYLKKLGKPCLFCLILLALVLAVSWLFYPKDNTREAGIEDFISNAFLAEPENTLDVLILGDSVPKFGLMPELMWHEQGYTSYVCATAGQAIPKAAELMGQFLERQSPRVILLESNILFRPVDGGYARRLEMERLFPVLRYHNNWKNVSLGQMLRPVEYTCTTPEKGYYLCKLIEPADNPDYMLDTGKRTELPEGVLSYVRDIQEVCTRRGIRLILVSLPSAQNMNAACSALLADTAGSLGIPYLDMNDTGTVPIDWQIDTADAGDHLNFWGAKKATRYLGTYLKNLELLPDHREDPSYGQWNADYDIFMTQAYAAYGNTDYNPIEE